MRNKKKLLVPRFSEIETNWTKFRETTFQILMGAFLEILESANNKKKESKPFTAQYETNFLNMLSEVVKLIPEDMLLKQRPFRQVLFGLRYPHEGVQKTSFSLLQNMVAVENQEMCLEEEVRSGTSAEANPLVSANLTLIIKQISVYQRDIRDLHSLLGYFLSWMVIFAYLEIQSSRLKYSFVMQLKDSDIVGNFLEALFEVLVSTEPHVSSKSPETFDLAELEMESDESVFHFSSYLYLALLKALPAVVRTWWNDCNDKQLRNAVDTYTEKRFSQYVITHQLASVRDSEVLKFDNMTVKATLANRQVTATYKKEDISMEVFVKLPANFPLRQVELDAGQKIGVSEMQWRKWMLSISTIISTQNGTIIEALKSWKQEADKKFEGIEECAICYYVIHAVDRSLPKIACKTCKHKFHGACLFKWFKSSNQSTCPLCRNIF